MHISGLDIASAATLVGFFTAVGWHAATWIFRKVGLTKVGEE